MSTIKIGNQNESESINAVLDTVTLIVEQGDIPCLFMSPKGLLQARKAGPYLLNIGLDFVAISHVRSQGPHLGDATLLRYLQGLQDYVRQVPLPEAEKLGFWIDIVCVPENDRKSLAISQIPIVFQAASAVIAFDQSWAYKRTESMEEACEAIRSSTWFERLWTIQEAAVGRHVFLAFSDRLLSLDAINESLKKHHLPSAKVEPQVEVLDNAGHFKTIMVEKSLQNLAQLQKDIGTHFRRHPAGSETGHLIFNKYGFRWLLRIGYLSMPRFKCLIEPHQYDIAQEVMLQIITNYDTAYEMEAEQVLSAIGCIRLAWEIVPEHGFRVKRKIPGIG